MSQIPATMKAWVVVRNGGPKDALQLKTDLPTPSPPKAGELIVKVSYATINPADLELMRMWLRRNSNPALDFVGEVVQVGQPTSNLSTNIRVGMTVGGNVPTALLFRGTGMLAEYVKLPITAVAEKPQGLDEPSTAALMGVAGQTTYRLLATAGLHKGDTALVNGASGGVGSILVKVLSAMGVRVIGICSGKNEAFVRKLGAEQVIDYTAHESLYDHLSSLYGTTTGSPFDAIFDCVGSGPLYWKCPGYLKQNGKFLSIAGGPALQLKNTFWPRILGGTPRYYALVYNRSSGAQAKEIGGWFEKGWIKEVTIDSIYEMKDAVEAFEKVGTKHTVGKIVIKVNQPSS